MFTFRSKIHSEVGPSEHDSHQLFLGWRSKENFRNVAEGKAKDEDENLKYLHLQSLVEQGIASWDDEASPRGVTMDADESCRLPSGLKSLFKFPPDWDGVFRLQAPEPTHSKSFSARLEVMPRQSRPTGNWSRKGCLLMFGGGDEYSLNSQQLAALMALEDWQAIPAEERAEADHQILLAQLQRATRDLVPDDPIESSESELIKGAKIDLGFADLEFGETDWEISIKELPDGGIQLVPTPAFDGSIDPDEILRRLHQIQFGKDQATLRLHRRIITLTPEQTKRTRELLKRGKLNAAQKQEFLKDPTAYLADHVFDPDDIEWSPRVKGIGEWEGSVIDPSVEGGMGMEVLGVERTPPPAEEGDDPETPSSQDSSAPPVRRNLDKYLPYPHLNLTAEEFSECLATERVAWGPAHPETAAQAIDEEIFRPGVSLKPHQRDAVRWMLAHAKAIDSTATQETPTGAHFANNRGGVLLADDMGLGKTISVLSTLAIRQKQMMEKGQSGAFLVVAPVSLLLTWKEELEKFFRHSDFFDRIVVLHVDHDLEKYRTHPKSADQLAESKDGISVGVKSLGLKLYRPTHAKAAGIDSPGSLVITNYETVQRFRFSFCAAKWEVLALDEAQATKNPNVMRTAAIKALNARFRILMTGTPVENSLVDFWCLNDTHSPGLFCSLRDFRENYISRIRRADPEDHETRRQVAAEVKAIVGETMLRRMKRDILDDDFPSKIEHRHNTNPNLDSLMQGIQLERYDEVRLGLRNLDGSDHHLALLHKLRLISLHPDLAEATEFPIGNNEEEAREILRRSVKGRLLVDAILPAIKDAAGGEKVLIFTITKALQWGLARNLEVIYPEVGRIPIINGDTNTKIKSTSVNPSRQKLIKDFKCKAGFHICILSPVAAGVGLTITEANHIVHFERHWNPAKEAQATDRAYRIGQTKDVHVWYPMSRHADLQVTSFDEALDRLMRRKISLQDSILSVEDTTVDGSQLFGSIFGENPENRHWNASRLQALDPLEFEALIACLYSKLGATRTELTIRAGDKGADVIAWNYPTIGHHCLVDAKHISTNRPLASAEGVRQVHAAGRIYSDALAEPFTALQVVTNSLTASHEVNRQAEACDVEIITGEQLLDLLANHAITMAEIRQKLAEPRRTVR